MRWTTILIYVLLLAQPLQANANTLKMFGYEILDAPKPKRLFSPGRVWVQGVGPQGPPLGTIIEGAGPQELSDVETQKFKAGLQGKVATWLSGVLGLQRGKILSVELTDVSYQQIEDVYITGAKGLMIYETIIATGIDVTVAKGVSAGLSLEDLTQSGFELTLSGSSSDVFKVTNSSDGGEALVVGIKVVNLQYGAPNEAQGTLPAGQVGQLRNIGLGYGALLTKLPSPATGSAQIRFRNSGIVQFKGETVNLSLAEPWINPVRFSISTDTSEFVWDLIEMAWAGTEIELFVTRQTLRVLPANSGL